MKNTTTDRCAEKQQIIAQKRAVLCNRYPDLWVNLIREWRADDASDAAWLTYSANYLFRTGGVRWAIDPLTLHSRLEEAPKVDIEHDLDGLSFVILSHDHHDHIDTDLIRTLRDKPIRWIIPSFLLSKVITETGISEAKVIVPRVMKPIEIDGLKILPFEGQHLITYDDGSCKGVPEMGYLIEGFGKRWLFPGDTRIYDLSRFPKLDAVDLLFAHLWLGYGSAEIDSKVYLEPFCKFAAGLLPKRVAITHLEEFGRKPDDFIDDRNAIMVQESFASQFPEIECFPVHTGEKIVL
jgi:L-ascorbate metabolism protein UlaG (beta-lactamase superfamily)